MSKGSWARFGLEVASAILASLVLTSKPVSAAAFETPCPLPYDAIKKHHAIDDQCDSSGSHSNDKQARQNGAKNNYCAEGPAALVTQLSFRRLQAKTIALHIPQGAEGHFPSPRSTVHDIYQTSEGDVVGEGSLVKYVGYVLHAKYSNTGSGESCNCKHAGGAWNDVHINLGPTRQTSMCQSIVAEMTPHFRPTHWDTTTLELIRTHPVRITGQLFFDSVHKPCTPGHSASPPRTSLWEIHPVYSCDVCRKKKVADCPVDDESVWEPIDHQSVVAIPGR